MPDLRFWLTWLASFVIVVAVLMVATGLREYWLYRKGK
jgi:hypothetical protein